MTLGYCTDEIVRTHSGVRRTPAEAPVNERGLPR